MSPACYPVNLAAQQEWHASRYPRPPAHPAPEVSARLASPEEMRRCRAAATVRKLARAHGWGANPTYARGTTLPISRSGARAQMRVIESIALRMRRSDPATGITYAAVAVWEARTVGGAFVYAEGWFWPTVTQSWPLAVNATRLRELLTTANGAGALAVADAGEPVLPIFSA